MVNRKQSEVKYRIQRLRELVQKKQALGQRVVLSELAEGIGINSSSQISDLYRRAFGFSFSEDPYNQQFKGKRARPRNYDVNGMAQSNDYGGDPDELRSDNGRLSGSFIRVSEYNQGRALAEKHPRYRLKRMDLTPEQERGVRDYYNGV